MSANDTPAGNPSGHDDESTDYHPDDAIYVSTTARGNVGTFHDDPDCWTLGKTGGVRETTYRNRPLRSEACDFCGKGAGEA